MFSTINRAFSAYMARPFLFMWGSFVYLFMFVIFLLTAFGLALLYFMLASALSYNISLELTVEALPNLLAAMVIIVLFLYLIGGSNAALIKTYYNAINGTKTSLLDFYHYTLSKAPVMFGILLMRDLISLLLIGPIAALYFLYLSQYAYMDVILFIYAIFVIFIVHLLATPAIISAALGASSADALRTAFLTIKTKHLYFVVMFILFAVVWLFNFVPLVDVFTIFFLYPVMYSALITFVIEGKGA